MDFRSLRPGFPVHPPAVARHLTFHLSVKENPNRIPDDEPRLNAWKALCNRLADHLNALRNAYGHSREVSFVPPDVDPGDDPLCYCLGGSCMVPINRPGSPADYRLRVRVDVHTELFSFTYIIDEIGWETRGHMAGLIDRLLESANPDGQSAAIDYLFNGIWQPGELPCTADIVAWRRRPGSRRSDERRIGTLITDFRGVIVCPTAGWKIDVPHLEEAAIRDDERRERDRRLDPALAEFAQVNEALLRHIADSKPEAETTEKGEAVVCGMLQGRALYAAALGEWSDDSERIQPIRHLLVYAGASYTQLGRLLRRMHILGELRHAALIDYDPDPSDKGPDEPPQDEKRGMRDASRAIAILSRDLTGKTRDITLSESPIEQLQGFVSDLAGISEMIDGGLTYRVEQSRYYALEFRDTIKHLRVTRIGDWQAYDDFVERYIMHLFARIDRIGNRYEALGRRLDRLLFFAQAKLLDSYTKSVDGTVQRIEEATDAMRRASERQVETLGTIDASSVRQIATLEGIDRAIGVMNENAITQIDATDRLNDAAIDQMSASRRQVALLKTAEAFAIVFLTYYVGYVIHNVIKAMHYDSLAVYFAFVWLAVAVVAVGNLVRVIRIGHRKASEDD